MAASILVNCDCLLKVALEVCKPQLIVLPQKHQQQKTSML